MRTNREFKDYVYKKANEKRVILKYERSMLLRGMATFSLLFIISGALIYGNFINNKHYTEEMPMSLNEDCRESYCLSKSTALGEFDNSDAVILYKAEVIGVNEENDVLGDDCAIISQDEALEIAKENCTVEYNATDVIYDIELCAWKIVFYTKNASGDCQTIFLNGDGRVKSIMYGE